VHRISYERFSLVIHLLEFLGDKMKKALVAAAVAGAFAAAPAMAAELSTNIYWSQGIAVGDTTTSEATDAANNVKVDAGGLNDGGGNRLMLTWSDTLDNGMGLTAYVGFGNLTFGAGNPQVLLPMALACVTQTSRCLAIMVRLLSVQQKQCRNLT